MGEYDCQGFVVFARNDAGEYVRVERLETFPDIEDPKYSPEQFASPDIMAPVSMTFVPDRKSRKNLRKIVRGYMNARMRRIRTMRRMQEKLRRLKLKGLVNDGYFS